MKPIVLQTHGLTKKYGGKTACKDVSLTLERGDVYGFVGPNGAGKSTVIKLITGLIKPTSGRVEKHFKGVGAVIESPAFYNHMTGRENLICAAIQLGLDTKAAVAKVLAITEMTQAADKKVAQYSLGMKQRLGIARAFLSDPDLIVLDEPTNGLDPYGIKAIRELIQSLAKQYGKTFLISSHILSELELMCTKIGIIHCGCLIEEKTLAALKAETADQGLETYFLEKTKEARQYV